MRSISLTLVLAAACGGGTASPDAASRDATAIDAAAIDAPPPVIDAPPPVIDALPPADAAPPWMLSSTGLYSDIGAKTIAPGVREFLPRWQLWSDAAVKRRWIYLPPGAVIATADTDYWHFPKGTRLWKEFVRDGHRIETRYLEKTGDTDNWADWRAVSFQWDATETDATAVPNGVVDSGGPNDIPAAFACKQCHGEDRIPSVVIGVSAILLDYAPGDPALLTLQQLIDDGRLSVPPTGAVNGAYYPLPDDAVGAAALGYLHVNCGHCHNTRSDVYTNVSMILRQDVSHLRNATSWSQTRAYTTTVGVVPQHAITGTTSIVEPGDPSKSSLYFRLTHAGGQMMPPLGREQTDPTGAAQLSAWISALPP